jgi:hypothetical protein
LATIVRGADTSRHDHEMLQHGMVMFDALYTWCRSLQAETHNWPAKAIA